MEKIKEIEIPDALKKWADNPGDYWLLRYIRSIGYTIEEIILLARDNDEIRFALDLTMDSLFEKTIVKMINGSIKAEIADFIYKNYVERFKAAKKRKVIELNLGGENFHNGSDNKESYNDDD
jgi:hypothetical protein